MTTVIEHVRDSRTPLRADLSPADALALSCLVYVDFHALPGPRSPRARTGGLQEGTIGVGRQ